LTKLYAGLGVILLITIILINFGNLNYNGYQPLAAHYIYNNSWSDENCKSCHNNMYDDLVNSDHVQRVNSNGIDGQWDPLFINLIEKEDTSNRIRECGLCHSKGIPPHNPTIAAVAAQFECSHCHSKDDKIFEIHDIDEIVGGSITTNCQTCHLDDISSDNLYLTHISDTTCANQCHQTDVATRGVMWSSDNYGAYDVHSNANISCIQCHVTSNHNIARGNIIDRSDLPETTDLPMKQCIDCHSDVKHGMIVDAHLETVSCEACHIPALPGGELPGGVPIDSINWANGFKDITFKKNDFQPVLAWFNGTVEGMPNPSDRDDPGAMLKPFNVISITWWDDGNDKNIINNPNSSLHWGSPILLPHIRAADVNRDGTISLDEMRNVSLNVYGKPDYPNAVLRSRVIYYSVSHNIVAEKSALGKSALWCADCHGNTSRIDWKLLGYDADPAQTDPPKDFTVNEITVEIIPARPEPVEVEKEPMLFKSFGVGQ